MDFFAWFNIWGRLGNFVRARNNNSKTSDGLPVWNSTTWKSSTLQEIINKTVQNEHVNGRACGVRGGGNFTFMMDLMSEQFEVCVSLGRKEMFYLTTHSTHFIYGYMASKSHSDSERVNPLPPHGLLFSINRKGYFICTIL